MSCKYPKESRMHYACILCDEKNACKDIITSLPLIYSNISMPEVQPPKNVIPSASEANKMTNNAAKSFPIYANTRNCPQVSEREQFRNASID